MVDRTELIPSESLGKKCILLYRLHPPFAGIEVAQYLHFSRHGTFGNIKQTVKVQTICFAAALPCADIQPALAAGKVVQGIE